MTRTIWGFCAELGRALILYIPVHTMKIGVQPLIGGSVTVAQIRGPI